MSLLKRQPGSRLMALVLQLPSQGSSGRDLIRDADDGERKIASDNNNIIVVRCMNNNNDVIANYIIPRAL